ncbi:MAG: penicillin-binding protein 2 [Gaiellaceae bacterium]
MASSGSGRRSLSDRFLPPDPRVEEPYRLTPQTALRVAVLGVITLGLFAVLFLRLWALQILSGPTYATAAARNQQRHVPIEAPRGVILDRRGRVLVTNVAGTAVQLWPADLPKGAGRDTEIRRLARVLRIRRARILAQIKARARDPLTPITLQVAVHPDQVAYILEHKDEFPGVRITETYLRRYKAEALATHVLGHVGEISEEQLKGQPERRLGDVVGQAGVEATYDGYLRGEPGEAELTVDSLGRPQSELRTTRTEKPGKAIRLTIDIALQRAAERALRFGIQTAREDDNWAANGGAIVALDPDDGEILALASNPTYRPSLYVGKGDPERLKVLHDAKAAKEANYPGLNRVVSGLYPAGSVWKPVTALAAMEEGLVSAYQTLDCTGQYEASGQIFKNWDPGVNEAMNMPKAIAASCDTYFYRLGHYFYGLPADRGHPLQAWASRFGFGEETGADIGPEEPGLLPTPEWRQETFTKERYPKTWEIDRLWKPGDSIQLAIGQKDLLVTPLQMARFYAMIANGGKLVTPHVVADVVQPGDGRSPAKVLQRLSPPASVRPSFDDPFALRVIQDGLYAATHAEYGTSTGVFGSFPVAIAGKTGTAEKVVQLPGYTGLLDQSWWCGYGPVEDPTIVVCALIENGGHGGTAAAPAARKVFEHFFGVRGGDVEEVYSD